MKSNIISRSISGASVAISLCILTVSHVIAQSQPTVQALDPEVRKVATESSREGFIKLKRDVTLTSEQFMSRYKTALGLTNTDDIRVLKTEPDALGFVHNFTQQYYQNVPVAFAELRMHEKNGRLNSLNGRIITNITADTNPSLSEADALQRALDFIGADIWAWEVGFLEEHIKERTHDPNATFYPKGQLWLTSPNGVEDRNGENYVLTWRFEIYDGSLENASMVYVNAQTGEITNSFPLTQTTCIPGSGTTNFYGTKTIHTDSAGGVYKLDAKCAATNNVRIHTRLLSGTSTLTEIVDSNNVWNAANQASAVTSHWGMEIALDYFQSVHGRNSYNGSGGDVDIYQGVPFVSSGGNNASFTHTTGIMRIGIGATASDADDINALDVVAHELGHGVTGTSAGLVYQGESGALNESYSDIWGSSAEYWALGGDWLIGEDLAIGAIRSMSNPKAFGDPDTYNGTNWRSTASGAADYGGVHSNSGVQNKWFQLLASGGSGTNDNGDDYNVKGIGIASASKIAYRNLTQYLNSGSNYMDARDNAIQAAEDLFMECSDEWISTQNAWYAVGVGDPALMIDSTDMTPTACDSMNGKLFVHVIGVQGTAQYQWSDPMMQTTEEAMDLDMGSYSVTITDDANGCMVDTTLEVDDDANFMLMATATDVTMCGADDGMANAATSGVTGTPMYMWSTGDNTQMLMNLAPGEYMVTVTDTSTMCMLDTLLEIKEDEIMVSIAGGGARTFCEDDDDREITLSVNATGCGMCTYTWSNGASGESTMVTSAGSYSVTAMDTSGCEGMADTEVQIWERDCDDCDVSWFWSLFGFGDCDEWMIPRLHATDPNDITGPTGYDSAHWVSVHDDITYTVRFENDPSFATAPAQVVKITVPIETDLNLFSFNLGSFGFGDFLFSIPPNTAFYQHRYDVTDSLGVLVDFTAGIDVTKNEAFWIFESIDPATNLPPDNALLGFLPVNDTTINIYNDTMTQIGEGFVNFTLKPKTTLMTGDTVEAQATIIFDINAPLPTNVWTNLIDAVPPVSQIDSAVAVGANYLLYFSGEDDPGGTGVNTYDLYASRDGAPFMIYKTAIDTNFYEVSGEEGSTYAYYTLATDNVGNKELPKTSGDTTVTFGDTGWQGGPIVYVNHAATGLNNGTNWTDAFTNLEDGLAVVNTFDAAEEVWIAQGSYIPSASGDRTVSFQLENTSHVYGGFEGIETLREDRDPTMHPVLLSGEIGDPSSFPDNSLHVVVIDSSCTDCILDGVEISFGYATGVNAFENVGAGILSFGTASLSDIKIQFCFALNFAAALFNYGPLAHLDIENSIIALNISILEDHDVLNESGAGINFIGTNTLGQ